MVDERRGGQEICHSLVRHTLQHLAARPFRHDAAYKAREIFPAKICRSAFPTSCFWRSNVHGATLL
jgi:hypothetical protein